MSNLIAYATFGGHFVGQPNGPFLTVKMEANETDYKPHKTGYGKRIKTAYMVKYLNRWRRVYCCQYLSFGIWYIESNRKPLATIEAIRKSNA